MRNLLVITLVIFLASPVGAAPRENIVKNGGFEQDTDGDGMADQWQFAGDKGVTVTWMRDQGFTGRFSQKLACTHFNNLSPASHSMLCQVKSVQLEKGKWYRISFAAKGQGIPGRAVHVTISNTQSWTNCGLQESFRVRTDWKEFEFVFKATETISEHTRLQFWYNSTGSFWLDNVRLEPSKPVEKRFTHVLPDTKAVNLLPNSSFECGTCGWGSIAGLPGWGDNLNLPVGAVDNTTGMFDGSSFKIALTPKTIPVFYFDYFPLYRVPVKAPLLANRGWIWVKPGADYTLSAYMKSDRKGLVGVVSVKQAFRGSIQLQVSLTTNWRRHVFTFQPSSKQIFVALGLDLEASKQEKGTVWIDAVQLEQGSTATRYRPRAGVEVGLTTNRLGNLFSHTDELKAIATVYNSEQDSQTVKLGVETTDFDDAVVHRGTVEIEVPSGQKVKVPINPGVQQKGFYRVHLRAEGAESVLSQSMRFAIIEPYTNSNSLFGMNHAYPWPHLLDLSRQIGLCWFRDWSLKWHDVEREKGRFDFTQADYQIDRVLEQGLNVLPLLPFPSSKWSTSAGPEVKTSDRYPVSRERIAYMPRDLEEFANYVHETVLHYRSRLHVWEILNEPIYTSYALPRRNGYQVKDYVQLLQATYKAVKKVDPGALVIGGIAGGPTTYTKDFIEAGGLHWVDALNLHAYPGLTEPEAYEESLGQLRERIRSSGTDKPIWFTEGSYYADDDKPVEPHDSTWLRPVDSEIEAAEWQVKLNTLLLAYGAEKIIYHSGTPGSINNESLSGIFFEWAGAPRKMLVTQAAMADLLVPPVTSLGCLRSPEDIRAYGFETGERTVVIAWTKEGAAQKEISLAEKSWQAVDLQGNELKVDSVSISERPIYFVAKGTNQKESPW